MIQTLTSPRAPFRARAGIPVLTMLTLGIAVLVIWTASVSTASAGQHPEGQDESQRGPNDDLRQCVIDTLGFFPSAMSDLTPEQVKSVGQNCARPGEGGDGQGAGQDGPEIDDATRDCIIAVLGYMPEGPEDMTEDQKVRLGQECFADEHGGGRPDPEGGPLDEATQRCIIDVLGYLPDGPDELTQEEQIAIGQACFGGQGGPGGPDAPDAETIECITRVLGYLPSGPDELTPDEQALIGRECFGGQGGPGDLDDETLQCVTDVLGFLPTGPDDLTDQQRIEVGRVCFADEPGAPDAEAAQCIIDVLGYLPNGPEELTPEEMMLVGQACFKNVNDSGNDLDEEANQCIIGILGYVPESPEDLSFDDKSRVGAECFGLDLTDADDLGSDAVACITGLLGYLPDSPGAMTADERTLVNRECFSREFIDSVGHDAGLNGDLAACLTGVLGYLPASPGSLSAQERILVARECFNEDIGIPRGIPGGIPGGVQGRIQGPGNPDDLFNCVVQTLGYVPSSPDALSPEEMSQVAQICLGGAGLPSGIPGSGFPSRSN